MHGDIWTWENEGPLFKCVSPEEGPGSAGPCCRVSLDSQAPPAGSPLCAACVRARPCSEEPAPMIESMVVWRKTQDLKIGMCEIVRLMVIFILFYFLETIIHS